MFRRSFFLLLLSALFLVPFQPSQALATSRDCWEACAPTMEEAREALASQIFVHVHSDAHIRQSKQEKDKGISFLSGWFSSSEIHAEASFESRQQVNMTLVNARVIQQRETAEGACLEVCRRDLVQYADGLLEKTRHYRPQNLPGSEREKKQTLNAWIGDIETAKNLATVFSQDLKEKDVQKRLIAQEKELKDLSAEIFEQSLSIQTPIRDAALILNGKSANPGEKIFLPEGMHTYVLTAAGYCETRGSILLNAGEDKRVHLHPEPFPTLTVTSNQPDASLEIAGVPWALGQEKTIERCEGNLSYTVRYAGESKSGSIPLKPGLKAQEKAYLFSDQDMQRLQDMASVFTKKSAFELGYAFSMAGSEFKDLHNIHKLSLAWYKNFRFLRLGFGAAYGRGEATEDSVTMDGYLSLVFQLSEIGGRERPLHFFGLFPVIPFAGLDAGVAYHDIHDKKTGRSRDRFPTTTSSEKSDFVRDRGLLRALGGLQIPVNSHVGLKCFYAKNFYMEEASEFGAALVLNF
ncbi:hypothetical protein [Desulfobotulus sp.]|uniref:hypothetical protein n=1 Tax=Desulfobotulus sp. TaxID=1940337 RepID=UPI002A3642EC|nr:hypothetical protein [Desulfobotulus sp.]MDY0162401.1 hypothetical protein [Desulfobotulus sp.]